MGEVMIVVKDTGFHNDSWREYASVTIESLPEMAEKEGLSHLVLRLENDQQLDGVLPYLRALTKISIAFPSSADGRGFSLARLLRLNGYSGKLRAEGSVLADQYRHARQCGFDEVAISPALAERMPEKYWLEQVPRLALSYQEKIYTGIDAELDIRIKAGC